MGAAYKVLGQSSPVANTLTAAYTVTTANASAVVSTIVIANREGASANFRIAVRPGGASIDVKHYIAYDAVIPALDTIGMTMGITLANTDVISVYSNNGLISFNIFGSEITP